MRFTVPGFLLAFLLALARMPLDIYQVCAHELGTVRLSPWQRTLRSWTAVGVTWLRRLRHWLRRAGGLPWFRPAVAVLAIVLIALAVGQSHGHLIHAAVAPAIVGRLKEFRQRAADLKSEIAAHTQRAQELSTAISALGEIIRKEKRALTDEEATKLVSLQAEKKSNNQLRAALVQEEADNAQLLAEAESANEAERLSATVADPDDEAAARAAGAAGMRVHMGVDRTQADPKRGFADHRDFLAAVMDAGRFRKVDARLRPLATQGSDEQGGYSDPAGGFLVPSGVAPGILSVEAEGDVLAGLATPVVMTAPTVAFNARVDKNHSTSVSGGFTVTRRPETVDGTGSRQSYEQVTLVANEEFGLAFASERIISDSPQSFVSIIQAGFRDEYAANAMNERINGTGTGERQGALSAGCKISVAKEGGQKAATILKENIDNMAARCWRYGRAIWIANHNTRPQLKALVQVVGTGGSAVPYLTGTPGGQEYLDNRPLYFTEFAKTLGTEGDLMLLVMSEYLEGTYQSEQFAESIHVRFAAAERAFRFYRRNDGQWWWRSALTPKNGSTLSPVVTLATRS